MMLQTTLAVLITGEVLVGTEVGTKEVSSIGLLAACWLATAVEGEGGGGGNAWKRKALFPNHILITDSDNT